jgi:partitioning defective protein 6
MMVANSSNLIITVKPVNQRLTLAPAHRGGVGRNSQMSNISQSSQQSSTKSFDSDIIAEHEEDDDEVEDLLSKSDEKPVLSARPPGTKREIKIAGTFSKPCGVTRTLVPSRM